MVSDAEGAELVRLARKAVEKYVAESVVIKPEKELSKSGVFVTINHVVRSEEHLRGCIGYPDGDLPLGQVVVRCAAAAAERDPRFPPVRAIELPRLQIELSVLGPLEPVVDWQRVEVGRHGVVVQRGHRRGLLLPQVAIEWGWSTETFLAQTCVKAGLPPEAWRLGAEIFRFEADVFAEASEDSSAT